MDNTVDIIAAINKMIEYAPGVIGLFYALWVIQKQNSTLLDIIVRMSKECDCRSEAERLRDSQADEDS